MLPFRPETLVQLRERIPAALERAYGARERAAPWKDKAHVFDFESGLRLIVSRRVIDIGCDPYLYVTASIVPHTMIDEYQRSIWYGRDISVSEWFKRVVIGQFVELHPTPLEFHFPERGVSHFFGDLREVDRAEQRLLAVG